MYLVVYEDISGSGGEAPRIINPGTKSFTLRSYELIGENKCNM
jgi:hypothetical protein